MSTNVYGEIPAGAIDGVNGTYALALIPNPSTSLQLFQNGLLTVQNVDYTLNSNIVTWIVVVPQPGDSLKAYYVGSSPAVVAPPGAGTFTELRGSDLVGMVQDRLGGYKNALDESVILDVLNEGKDEVWAILKNLSQNYFQASTRYDDPTQTNYFGSINTKEREYALPADFRAIRFIECVTPGFQNIEFTRRSMTSPTWKDARRAANELSNVNGVASYFYDIAEQDTGTPTEDTQTGANPSGIPTSGGFELVFAQFPETTLQLVIWYLRAIPDMEADTVMDQIIRPFSKKIANFAVEKCMKILQDVTMSESWLKSWRNDVITIAQTGGNVDQADSQYVQDFVG
jgi:hypothetical protein